MKISFQTTMFFNMIEEEGDCNFPMDVNVSAEVYSIPHDAAMLVENVKIKGLEKVFQTKLVTDESKRVMVYFDGISEDVPVRFANVESTLDIVKKLTVERNLKNVQIAKYQKKLAMERDAAVLSPWV